MEKWLTVQEYAKVIGKSVPQVYYDIRFEKIPKDRIRIEDIVIPITKKIKKIRYDTEEA